MPHLIYSDVAKALAWLTEAFGFSEYYRSVGPDGAVGNAQMYLGNAWIMLGSRRHGDAGAIEGRPPQSLVLFVADVDARFERARSAGAKVVSPPADCVFGERQCEVEDPEGHRWFLSQHIRDVAPEDWGASPARPNSPQA